MMYVGFPIEFEEGCRLLGVVDIEKYLKEMKSTLVFEAIDKNLCVLGIPIKSSHAYIPFDVMISYILDLKHEFVLELKRLNVDTSEVYIAHMHELPDLVEYPDPYVLYF